MPKNEDSLSALRSDIVREIREQTGAPESEAFKIASKIMQAMHSRFRGERFYVSAAKPSDADLLEAFDGRNHAQVCRRFMISRSTLYRAIARSRK